jgi:hypothetical protein
MQLSMPNPFSLGRIRLLSVAAAVLLAEVVGLGAQFVFGIHLQAPAGTVAASPVDISPLTIALASLVPSLAGWALLACLERLTRHASRYWLAIALAVLIGSLFGPLAGTGVSHADRTALILIHLTVAITLIGALYSTSSRRSRGAALPRPTTRPTSAHAAHRPPVHSDRLQSTPPLVFGVLYPRDDVVAVFDDADQAYRAQAALRGVGIPEDDSDVLEPTFVLAAKREIEDRRGWLGQLLAGVSRLASDDARYIQSDWHEAERGHSLVVVHASTAAVVEQVREVLSAHGARGMRHYGRLVVTELS